MKHTVDLVCEKCGVKYQREDVPEHYKTNVYFKWRFKYCDACVKEREKEALKLLPEVIGILVGEADKEVNPHV